RLGSGVWGLASGPTVETVGYGRLSLRDCALAPIAVRISIVRAQRSVHPLPGGEGRGEGERELYSFSLSLRRYHAGHAQLRARSRPAQKTDLGRKTRVALAARATVQRVQI